MDQNVEKGFAGSCRNETRTETNARTGGIFKNGCVMRCVGFYLSLMGRTESSLQTQLCGEMSFGANLGKAYF